MSRPAFTERRRWWMFPPLVRRNIARRLTWLSSTLLIIAFRHRGTKDQLSSFAEFALSMSRMLRGLARIVTRHM